MYASRFIRYFQKNTLHYDKLHGRNPHREMNSFIRCGYYSKNLLIHKIERADVNIINCAKCFISSKDEHGRGDIPSLADFKDKGLNAFPGLNDSIKNMINQMPSNPDEFKTAVMTNMPNAEQIKNNAIQALPDLREINSTPLPVFILSTASLIPLMWPIWRFIGAGYILPNWEFLQLAYSSCVIAFLGGIRWGLILNEKEGLLKPDWRDLSVGVGPFVLAVSGLLLNPFLGYITLMAGYAVSAYVDLINPGCPNWYKVLHTVLTGVAISFLAIALMLKIFLRRQPEISERKLYE